MRPEERDLALLWDMREAARDIIAFTSGLDYQQFETDKLVRAAVERQVMIIGEAANKVSEGLKQRRADIPWRAIIGQRNILAHEYGEILVERVWLLVKDYVPRLVQQMDSLIPDSADQ